MEELQKAILPRSLLQVLWRSDIPDMDRRNDLENILVKFSLLVPLIRASDASHDSVNAAVESADGSACRYLVPAILPHTSVSDLEHDHEAFLIFATKEKIKKWTDFEQKSHHCLEVSKIKKEGFYPMGIFPRLLSKIVTQIQRVDGLNIQDEAIKLSEDSANLEMERCKFSCSLDFEHGCIRVGFWGPDPPNRLVLLLERMKGCLLCP